MNRVKFYLQLEKNAEIRLPTEGEVQFFIAPGQKISKGQSLYKMRRRELKESYYLPKVFGIRIDEVRDYIGRVGGEYVMEGDLLAEKLASGGLVAKKIVASNEGIVSIARLDKGFLDIVGEFEELDVVSQFDGEVIEIVMNSYIRFKVPAGVMPFMMAKNISSTSIDNLGEASGELVLLGQGESVFHVKQLEESYSDKIVFVGRHLQHDLAVELYKRGAVAIITYAMEYADFKEIAVPVVVLAGFGQLRINTDIVGYLRDNIGSKVKIETDRKELLFVGSEATDLSKFKGNRYFAPVLVDGDKVYIKDGERYSTTGTLTSLGEKNLEEEGFVSVKTEDGVRTLVYSDSLEILQG